MYKLLFRAQVWVYGNSFESFLVAVVVPERQALENWAVKHDLSDDFKSLCGNLKARKFILDELNSIGQKHQVCIYTMFNHMLNFWCHVMLHF